MIPSEILRLLPVIFQFFLVLSTVIISIYLYYFVFRHLSPKMRLRIIPNWIDNTTVVLGLEVENYSKVGVRKKIVKLQILPYLLSEQRQLSEFVPLDKSWIKEDEKPLKWQDPVEIFETTSYLYPGEITTVERLVQLPEPGTYLHVALQFRATSHFRPIAILELFKKRSLGLLIRFKFKNLLKEVAFWESESWTTTRVLIPSQM